MINEISEYPEPCPMIFRFNSVPPTLIPQKKQFRPLFDAYLLKIYENRPNNHKEVFVRQFFVRKSCIKILISEKEVSSSLSIFIIDCAEALIAVSKDPPLSTSVS